MGALEGIAPELRTFFVPQFEQLGTRLEPVTCGVRAVPNAQLGSVSAVACAAGPSCVVTSHCVVLEKPFLLEEAASRSLCIASVSDAGVGMCPVPRPPRRPQPLGAVVLFGQKPATERSMLRAREVYGSVSVNLLPRYFDELADARGRSVAEHAFSLIDKPGIVVGEESAPYVRVLLRALDPLSGCAIQSEKARAKLVERIVAIAALEDLEARRARSAQGLRSQRAVASRVRALVEASGDVPPTIEHLAADLHISRARLCAAFKAETGEGVGAYIARRRMDKACALLERGSASVAEVAAACGYAHQSSFAEAFKRATGKTPRQWADSCHRS